MIKACDEDLLLTDFFNLMASIIQPGMEKTLTYKRSDSDVRPLYSFLLDEMPSVTRGPISTDKAKHAFNFKPHSLRQTLQESADFYNQAYKKFPKMRKMIEKDIRCGLLTTEEEKDNFDRFIRDFTN